MFFNPEAIAVRGSYGKEAFVGLYSLGLRDAASSYEMPHLTAVDNAKKRNKSTAYNSGTDVVPLLPEGIREFHSAPVPFAELEKVQP